jgi:hypothetical protein
MKKIYSIYLLAVLSVVLSCAKVSAQGSKAYVVQLKDKAGTPFTVSKPEDFLSARSVQRRKKQNISVREDDLPVSPNYVKQIEDITGVKVVYRSRWFNSVLVFCTQAEYDKISALPFVVGGRMMNEAPNAGEGREVRKNDAEKDFFSAEFFRKNTFNIPHSLAEIFAEAEEVNFGASKVQNEMLGVDAMHRDGFRGEGIRIAVIDAGFPEYTRLWGLGGMEVFDTYNFITRDRDVSVSSSHGTRVLSAIAANRPGEMVGTAPKASFALYISEDSRSEFPVEEFFWLMAAERADSAGVDVINTSLGYYDFDNPAYDYKTIDLDGKTALITRASEKAFEKGMFLVTSAGNEGSKPWAKITFPADAPNTLTVGAVDALQNYASFSSIGPSADGRIKPDVVAMGSGTALWGVSNTVERSNGTSFSAPVVCGLAAGLWQANPELTNAELLSLIRRSGSRMNFPNETFGYGIPSYPRAQELKNVTGMNDEIIKGLYLLTNPIENEKIELVFPSSLIGKKISYQLFSVLGQVESEGLLLVNDTNLSIEAKGLISGLHFLKVNTDNQSKVFRCVVK